MNRGGAPSLIVFTTLRVRGSTRETEPSFVFGTHTAFASTAGTPAPRPTFSLHATPAGQPPRGPLSPGRRDRS